MKKLSMIPLLLLSSLAFAQNGYEIKVTLKPVKNQYIYLGHYSGKQYPVVDSVKLNEKSEGVFKGPKELGGGIYLVVYPNKDRFLEILIDKKQQFSLIADTTDSRAKKFVNSPDNELFNEYQKYMARKGATIESNNNALKTAKTAKDSAGITENIKKTLEEISAYRSQFIAKHPDNILSLLMHLMEEPKIPPAEKHPGGKYDSTFAYRYFKDHYWDGLGFWDDRMSRTPASLFDERLDKYYNTLVYQHPDSVIKEIDWMLGYASASPEMTRYLLVKFVNRYLNMKYMWEDKVFVHLFEKYFSQKNYDWLTPQGKKIITERAYSLMANIMGNPAENISLPDTAGVTKVLYSDTSRFTIVCFWDPTCGHCKEVLPVMDSMYQAKWKHNGVKIYAVAKETDGSKKDWMDFIHKYQLKGWTNVYYSKAEEKTRVDAGIPGYTQLYDAQVVPAVFLLDRDKRIIAKKLTWQQADEIINVKMQSQ
ncbi:TlpA family protein disulfide reductase [Terrimonas pollutisoli]|uniref:TlpA family protein disulfide reductase n=1 Tax=Terrimonas pollutisoli TaxID=3034147 RepID=UPI0023ED2B4B|nr:TlpA family protein disulfide reductase [Terrimonas sp. H1YJ31]